ncbi:MAG TPA: hypothetical protein VFC85_03185, partial [Verrucomicrobiae bacterium]|nr:hypothetical protein [Verrucomicrobiae bacterium]
PFPSFNGAALVVFQNMESGTDQFRLAFFRHLKNQHEAKCFQPDARLALVVVWTIENAVVEIKARNHGFDLFLNLTVTKLNDAINSQVACPQKEEREKPR